MLKWVKEKPRRVFKTKADYIVLLLSLCLSQEEAADLIGCSRVTLNRQINGHIDRDWIKEKLSSL